MTATSPLGAGRVGAARTLADRQRTRTRGHARAPPRIFLAPYLAPFITFVLVPIVFGIWISLHSWDYTLPRHPFVGLQNYAELFQPDSINAEPFWSAMRGTGFFTLGSVPLLLVIPLLVALLMNQKFPGRNFFR